MARTLNPRRQMLAKLKPTRDRLKWVADRWTWMGTKMHYATGERPRLRTPEEYPENSAAEWRIVIAQIDCAISELVAVRDFAEAQSRIAGRD